MKSFGPDGINNEILNWCWAIFEKYLATTFNKCFKAQKNSYFFKIEKILPTFKKDEQDCLEIDRPISSLCSISLFHE